jgi:hypothetical protein
MQTFIYSLGIIVFLGLFLWGAVITYLSGKPNHKEHHAPDKSIDVLDLPIFTNPKCKTCDRLLSCHHLGECVIENKPEEN